METKFLISPPHFSKDGNQLSKLGLWTSVQVLVLLATFQGAPKFYLLLNPPAPVPSYATPDEEDEEDEEDSK